MKEKKYLYCVIKEQRKKEFNIAGMEGKKVYTVNEGELAMLVSDSETAHYPFIRENIMAHHGVVEEAMKKYDVLPVCFNTLAQTTEDIKERVLKARAKEFLILFPKVEENTELNLKAMWVDMPNIFQEIVNEDQEILRAKKLAQKNKLNPYQIAALGERIAKRLERKREHEAQEILAPLKQLAVEFKEKECGGLSSNPMGNAMIFNTAFFIPKKAEELFNKQVARLMKEYKNYIHFIPVSPLPPFTFAELHITI